MNESELHTGSPYRTIFADPAVRWIGLTGAWTAFGLFMGWQTYYQSKLAGDPMTIADSLMSELVYAYLWALLTPLILRLAWKFPLDARHPFRNSFLHLVLSALTAFVHKSLYHLILMNASGTFGPFAWTRFIRAVWNYLDYGIILYWILILLYHAVEYYRRSREQELRAVNLAAELTHAQLQTLRMQLHPHFLFNTLNAVSVLIGRKPDAAREMLGRLSGLLRRTLAEEHRMDVPLREEIDLLGLYLAIEKVRFEDRLTVSLDVGPETLDAVIPSFLLQPFVENAMRYGVARKPGPALVEIRTSRNDTFLRLEIMDNGPGLPPDGERRDGIGFTNTRSRLEQMYGTSYRFTAANRNGGGAHIILEIPFRADHLPPRTVPEP